MTADKTYPIGAVSRLLGLSTHALRKWEVRHGAVAPSRSEGGDRRYSRDDFERLARLKELVDLGHAISTIASLTNAELDDLLGRRPTTVEGGDECLEIAVLGDRLWQELNEAETRLPLVQIIAHASSADELGGVSADAIIVEIPSLAEHTRDELRAIRELTGIDRLLVVYRFGSIEFAERLSDSRTATFGRPINLRELGRALHSISGDRLAARPAIGLPPHRFTRKLLSDVAMMSPELACECPRHVAQIIIELSDFEAYSEDCEINKPDDAVVHGMLRRTAATARSLFEDALIDLAASEDIDLSNAESR